ncbi:cytochrome c-type biogenesis protein CcmH [Vibrio sp. JC009]|uniref:cytochrome c-type biogenesis protein n=1 Tax=Vibrio sp. JC009 TaxID=2912314 RepID=UPI0023AE74E9|nr:cytochrome c-type biogenesis protein [Vibrio sp. JC009]WED20581.1 cytochrome c-type biogenesis protein CcmH [Vibrio sp. JC009]
MRKAILFFVQIFILTLTFTASAEQSVDSQIFYDSNKEIAIKADLFEFDSEEQRMQATELARQLRCPQCQNQNLIESNSPVAKDLRLRVFEMVKAGDSEEEIVEYMTQRFGEFVLYDPVVSSRTYVLWFLPLLLLVIGVVVAVKSVSRKN